MLTEKELRKLKAQEDGRIINLFEWTYSDGYKKYCACFNNGGLSEEITKEQYDKYSKFMTNGNDWICNPKKECNFQMTAYWTYEQGGNGLPRWFNWLF